MFQSEKYPQTLIKTEDELDLGQIGSTLRRRALLIVGMTGVVATAATLKTKADPPIYEGNFEILTKPVTGESKAIANIPQSLGSQQQGAIAPPELESVPTTIQVLYSRGILDPVVQVLQTRYPNVTYNSVVRKLKIKSEKPNILEVEYTHSNPQQVRDVLSLLKDAYLQYSLAERQEEVNQAIYFVNQQVKPLRQRVEDWQEKLRTLRSTNNLIDPAQKAQEVSNHVTVLTQNRLDNRVQLQQMLARYNGLQTELGQQAGASPSNPLLSENASYQKLLAQVQEVNAQIARRSVIFTNEEEGMKRLNEQQANLVGLLEQERARVNREYQSRIRELQTRDVSLGEKINSLNIYLRTLATTSRDYENIQRELRIATDALTQFTAKQQALEIEKAQRLQPWKSLDPRFTQVYQPAPAPDNLGVNLAMGGVLGMLLGVGAALVLDKLSNVFYTTQDLKDATTLPLLGVVPLRKELGALALQEDGAQQATRASFFEVFRSLYTNILLLGSDTPIRSLVISSAQPEEGKTTVAIQLALAAAAMGQRVLLVDANLRCPTIHNRVGLMNIQGLTDLISQDLDWSNVIERSPLEDNLFVLTAGPVPPDSTRLLASHKMQDLMDNLQSSFDLVIYDTPPLVGFADANLLAANTNGVMLVAGLRNLKRTVFHQALEEIQVAGTPVLGVVANKSKDATPASHSHYQQYYRQSVSIERVGEESNNTNSKTIALKRIK